MQHGLDMTPCARVIKKFNYFYRPYSCEVNVRSYMTFSDERDSRLLYDLENLIIQETYGRSRAANEDAFGDLTDHERKNFTKEIFEA